MLNVNKLIEIINEINSDEIIYTREMGNLKTWHDNNRNLAYEPRQIELIKLVDSVIDKHIINYNEKEMMLMYSKKLLYHLDDDMYKIYILNDIIEKITFNGRVNKKEMYCLKEWMTKKGEYIREKKSYQELYTVIDGILSNGMITEKEQERLLQILKSRINGYHLKIKLKNLKNKVRSKNNIGLDLIDLLDDKEVINEIHCQAQIELNKALNSYSGSCGNNQEIVFISLVLIAMLHYDGNFYESVRTIYKKLYDRFSEQKIEGVIRTILGRYRSIDEESCGRSRIINVALSNAIVPNYYLKSFFEFIYDIYKTNFEYNLSDDLYGDFQFIYEGLRSNMLSSGDNIQINVTKKSYKLIKSTKELISNTKHIDVVIKLSTMIANLIDKSIWDKEFEISNPYLKQGYEEWIDTIKEDRDIQRQRNKSEFRSRWEPKFILSSNSVYLVPPIHRIKSNYDYRSISIIVRSGEEVVYCNETPDIREIIGGYQINIDKLYIKNPLGEVSYQLVAGKDIIYDSKQKLYRSFMVFNDKGMEIQNNTDYSGTAVFCTSKVNKGIKEYYTTDNYILSVRNVKLGDAIVIKNTVFNFSSLIKPGVFGYEWSGCYVLDVLSGDKIPVFKNIQFLVFEYDNKFLNFDVIFDTRRKHINEFQYSVTKREGVNKYVVDLNCIKSGMHKIEVYSINKGKANRIFSFKFALDINLNIETVKIDDMNYLVSVESDISSSNVVHEIKVESFDENWMNFVKDEKEYCYYIPFELELYRINGGKWTSNNEEIWIEDINQNTSLDLYGNDVDVLQILSSNGQMLDQPISLKNEGIFQQVPIGFLTSYKMSYDYTVLVFMKNGKSKKAIFCYNTCKINEEETEMRYNSELKCLDILPKYYGKGRVFFSITDDLGNEVYRSPYLEKGVINSSSQLNSFVNYKISFFEKAKGLSIKKEKILKTYDKIFYAPKDFVGKSFKIVEVYFDQLVKGEFLRKNHYFNTTYVHFKKQVSNDVFVGEIYVKTYNGIYVLNNINPVVIEVCSDVIDGTMELAITKDRDGLLLDFEHHGIMNTMDSDTAVDIFSYIINMNGVRTF
ncbi:hypothetical protein [Clostridium butyricum]|uniref:hypothetical protein n=1 Tax=Clostridium butyricum TaxID=1492 RepID=UPI000904133A|nr:hypothetical protein [Clostridium butyricum]APF21426.1 hypothetical protein NPD4_3797 [Clostridium butyricum]